MSEKITASRPRWLALVGAIFSIAAAASAETIPAHEHIGRLNHAGFKSRAHCTAFLAGAGRLVTAAHCLPRVPKDAVHVLLSYARGEMTDHLSAPGKAYRQMGQRDLAVLCRSRTPGSGLSLDTTEPTKGTRVLVRGYGVPKVHVLQKRQCTVSAILSRGFAALDCPVPAGVSGAPVMDVKSEKVIGVVSASGKDQSRIALLPPRLLDSLCEK